MESSLSQLFMVYSVFILLFLSCILKVGLMTYSYAPLSEFDLNRYENKTELLDAISKTSYTYTQGTYTDKALKVDAIF